MSDIFLSYASKDRERVRQLASLLETQGWSVFWDRAIPTGMRWHEILGDELDASKCVVVVWTASSIRSQWVYEEAEEGKRKGALFPVKLDNVLPPLGFRTFQVANLSEWQGDRNSPALTRLLQDLEAHFTQLRQQAEVKQQAVEAARQAEAERKRAEEAAAQQAEAERKAAEERQQAEADAIRQAEAERKHAEEAAAQQAEAERKAAEERQHLEAATILKAEVRPAESKTTPSPDVLLKQANYEIIDKLGEGGMATVYRARHTVLEREVALKLMSPQVATTEAFRQSFIREARIVAQLEHPHIVRIYDGGADGNQFYMAMELLTGGTLKDQLECGPVLPEHAFGIVQQIASALSYAHAKGYIHRDIKPANILFRSNGDAALADFGIAKLRGIVSDLTQLGLVSGTPHYMSPEQVSGQAVDQRSDIYSLGIVLYEMLTGKRPYGGGSIAAIAHQHLHVPIPKLSGDNARYQPLLEQMVAKQAGNRFPSAESLLQELQKQSLPTMSQVVPPVALPAETLVIPPPAKPVTSMANKRNSLAKPKLDKHQVIPAREDTPAASSRGLWLVGVAVLATLGAGGGYYMVSSQEHEQVFERLAQQQEEAARERQEQINEHLKQAEQQEQKQFLFDHSVWSGGCRSLLQDKQGFYDAFDSAEWHYRQATKLDPSNTEAFNKLEQLEKRRKAEFSDCDTYLRSAKGTASTK